MEKIIDIPLSLTFDDVLLVPQYSDIASRQDVNVVSKISKNVTLNIPFVSSNMDTVTEDKMAITMARLGGIGIIHRYCSIEEQVEMVKKVKRAESYIIYNSYTALENETIGTIKTKITKYHVKSYLITDENNILKGILTRRDIKFTNENDLIKTFMTSIDKMIVCKVADNVTMDQAKKIMCENKIQKLPIVDENNKLVSLICLKDIERIQHRPLANLDANGKLRCGAAIGVKEDAMERATKLVAAGVDVLVIDIAHGFSKMCLVTLMKIKKTLTIDVIAGNVATAAGAEALIKAGADGIKVGIGNGSICTTRMTAGAGVPQFSALLDTATVCKKYNVPLISDGGNRHYGNMAKALGAGADCIMLGRMIAGSEESPGKVLMKDGKRVKIIRGMAGVGANLSNAKRQGIKEPDLLTFTPEGVEGYIPYSGPVQDSIKQMCDAIKSGLSYTGAHNINEMYQKAKFVRITQNGMAESAVHDISNFDSSRN